MKIIGDEPLQFNDYMGIVQGIRGLQNIGHQNENQSALRKDREKDEAVSKAENSALTMMNDGFTPDETRKGMQGRSLVGSGVDDRMNNEIAPTGVAMNWAHAPGKTNFKPAIAEKGFQQALQTDVDSIEKTHQSKALKILPELFKMSPKDVEMLDVTTKGEDGVAYSIAKEKYFTKMGETEAAKIFNRKKKKENQDLMFNSFRAGIGEARRKIKEDPEGAKQILANNINQNTPTAHKVKILPNGNMSMYITYDGIDKFDDKEYSAEEMLAEQERVTPEYFTEQSDKDYQMSLKINKGAARWFSNGKELVRVKDFRRPLGPEHQHMIFKKEGGVYPIQNLTELQKAGFYELSTKKSKGKGADKTFQNMTKAFDKVVEMVTADNSRFHVDPVSGGIVDANGQPAGRAVYREALKEFPAYYKMATGKAINEQQLRDLIELYKEKFPEPNPAGDKDQHTGFADSLLNLAGMGEKPDPDKTLGAYASKAMETVSKIAPSYPSVPF